MLTHQHTDDLLTIEATLMRGRGKLTLTGQLGDVMKESAQAALSYVRGHVERLQAGKRRPDRERRGQGCLADP